jgi:hypothetical protein
MCSKLFQRYGVSGEPRGDSRTAHRALPVRGTGKFDSCGEYAGLTPGRDAGIRRGRAAVQLH